PGRRPRAPWSGGAQNVAHETAHPDALPTLAGDSFVWARNAQRSAPPPYLPPTPAQKKGGLRRARLKCSSIRVGSELVRLGRVGEGGGRALAFRDRGRHGVEIADADFALVAGGGEAQAFG